MNAPIRANVRPDLVLEPVLNERERHLLSLSRIEVALQQRDPRPSRVTRESLIHLHAVIRDEVRRLEDAWRAAGPSLN